MLKFPTFLLVFIGSGLLFATPFLRAESIFKKGDVYAICGDSLTQQGVYSTIIEDYLLMCQSVPDIKTIQCGWSGAAADSFSSRMKDGALLFSPTIASTCFGMNDGGYNVISPAVEKQYRESLVKIIENLKEAGVRTVIVGSPGAVDSYYFRNPKQANVTAEMYNQTLGRLGEIAQEVAREKGVLFADLHTPMMETMAKVKAEKGEKYVLFGATDGVHATPNGHLIMAYAFLKAMGFDGNIGTITYDATAGTAEATEAHRVVSAKVGEVTIESTRYPYCYGANLDHHTGPIRSILPFLPFNQDLNRYILVVKNLRAPKAKITWGKSEKEFTATELAQGINLAAEFLDNPFTKPFLEVHEAVAAKLAFQIMFIKDYLGGRKPVLEASLPHKREALNSIARGLHEINDGLLDDVSAKAVKPVSHTIKIDELN